MTLINLITPAALHRATWKANNKRSYAKHKAKRIADVAAYRIAHPEKVRLYYARNRLKHGERQRKEQAKRRDDAHAADPRGTWLLEVVRAAQTRARKRGLPFDQVSDVISKIALPDTCPVLGIALAYHSRRGVPGSDSPSLDRVVPSLGYVASNLRVISNRANTLKNNATVEEMRLVLADMEKQ